MLITYDLAFFPFCCKVEAIGWWAIALPPDMPLLTDQMDEHSIVLIRRCRSLPEEGQVYLTARLQVAGHRIAQQTRYSAKIGS